MITHAELTNEKVKPVLQTGEALSDARAFPLINAAGQQTGLDLETVWILHYWAQNNRESHPCDSRSVRGAVVSVGELGAFSSTESVLFV